MRSCKRTESRRSRRDNTKLPTQFIFNVNRTRESGGDSGLRPMPAIKTQRGFEMAGALFPEPDDSQLQAVDPELGQPASPQ